MLQRSTAGLGMAELDLFVPERDFPLPVPERTEGRIIGLLSERYEGSEWEFIPHFHSFRHDRTADAIAINTWQTRGCHRVGFEVKVSRSDYKHELEQPEKRKWLEDFCHQFYFVVPIGLVKADEVPEGCGLIYATAGGLKQVKLAKQRKVESVSNVMLAAVARAVGKRAALGNWKIFKYAGRDLSKDDLVQILMNNRDQIAGEIREAFIGEELRLRLASERKQMQEYQDALSAAFGRKAVWSVADLQKIAAERSNVSPLVQEEIELLHRLARDSANKLSDSQTALTHIQNRTVQLLAMIQEKKNEDNA